MYKYAKIAIQPFPYSKSLMFSILKTNNEFTYWYNNFDFIHNTYYYNHNARDYNYSIQLRYDCIKDKYCSGEFHDVITGKLSLNIGDDNHNESIRHKIKYFTANDYYIPFINLDYKIKTEYSITKNNKKFNDLQLLQKKIL